MTGAPYFSAPEFYGNNLLVVADATAQIAGLGYQAYLLPSPIVIVADGQLVLAETPRGPHAEAWGLRLSLTSSGC